MLDEINENKNDRIDVDEPKNRKFVTRTNTAAVVIPMSITLYTDSKLHEQFQQKASLRSPVVQCQRNLPRAFVLKA